MTIQLPSVLKRAAAPPAHRVVAEPTPRRSLTTLLRGRPQDPTWARPALLFLLAATAVLYLWNLGASGDANSFYAAAAQAGTKSWKAMFFGSSDAGNSITVDKPAFFLWPMEISGRIFGFSSWSMLVPQALEGVAAVALLNATVRRVAGPVWGLFAGAALALTPAAVLMFRFNNPDAMLVLLLIAATYGAVRALEVGSGKRLTLAGTLVGLGFVTKMGQALLVVPALGLAYLICAPVGIIARIKHLAAAVAAMVLGAGWYIAIVDLWPAGSRPYIGGSTDNSLLQLALGYNGIGRLLGQSGPGGGGGGGGGMGGNGSFGGATGWGRLFRSEMGQEISWLLPAALLALVAGFWLLRKAPRTDLRRAALIAFGGSMVTTAAVFSWMNGTIHPYYTLALAPGIAGVLAVTGSALWEQRNTMLARVITAALVEITVAWDMHLLGSWEPTLRAGIFLISFVAVLALLFAADLKRFAVIGVIASMLALGGGSAACAVSTASHPHTGSIPSAGPVTSGIGGGPGGDAAGTSSSTLTKMLAATTTRWAAATTGSQTAAGLQLSSGKAVMPIGGFTGSDNAPTLAQFEKWVAAGDISYYVGGNAMGGGGGPGGGGGSASQISTWVASHYTAQTIDGQTVYDLRS